jgi:hypothetical protein
MSRGELAIVVGVLLCAIGAGLFHPGAGFLVGGLGLASFGAIEIRYPATEPPADEEAAA